MLRRVGHIWMPWDGKALHAGGFHDLAVRGKASPQHRQHTLIHSALQARAAARAAKDFALSDSIRIELEGQGIIIMDTPQGTSWRPA